MGLFSQPDAIIPNPRGFVWYFVESHYSMPLLLHIEPVPERKALDLLHLMALFSHFRIRRIVLPETAMAPASRGRHASILA